MAQFERKAPVYEALQFTGGEASAREILEGLAAVAPEWSARFIPATSEFGIEEGQITETPLSEKLRIFDTIGTEYTAVVGDWVLARDGLIQVFPDTMFQAQFQPI